MNKFVYQSKGNLYFKNLQTYLEGTLYNLYYETCLYGSNIIEFPNSIFEMPRVNTNFIIDRSQTHSVTVEAVPVKN